MKFTAKTFLLALIIFLILFCITPFVSKYSGCVGGGPLFGCVVGTTNHLAFPVYRTVACKLWHEAGCAPDTLIPGWYDHLLNSENVIILLLLALISVGISSRVTRKMIKSEHG